MAGEKYEYGIDSDRVAAIDIHTFTWKSTAGADKAYDDELADAGLSASRSARLQESW